MTDAREDRGRGTTDVTARVFHSRLAKSPRQMLRQITADARTADFTGWCRAKGLPEPIAEYRFAPPRRWRFDWCWIEANVVLEVEGGIWIQGRHSRGAGMLADMQKYNHATLMGWRVLRTTPQTLKSRETLSLLTALLT